MLKLMIYFLLFFSIKAFSSDWLNEFSNGLTGPLKVKESREVLMTGAFATFALIAYDHNTSKNWEGKICQKKPLGKWSAIGSDGGQIIPNILYSLGYFIKYQIDDQSEDQRHALDMFNATLYSGFVTDVMKPIINETRPNGGKYSFPSGHATTAFAFAAYVAAEHSLPVGILSYSFATFVALCRLNDKAHFPHDVVAGASIGTAYGLAEHYRSYSSVLTKMPMVLPSENGGVQLAYHFRF